MTLGAIGLFIFYTDGTYKEVSALRQTQSAYSEALQNSRKLLAVRDQLASKYNALSREDRDRLEKLMPDNVDNIRLILNIDKVAKQYGMLPSDIKFDASATDQKRNTDGTTQPRTPAEARELNNPYGTFNLEFSVTGTYPKFLAFLHDLEQSLRLIDVEAVAFAAAGPNDPLGSYRYTFKIQTYWLKK